MTKLRFRLTFCILFLLTILAAAREAAYVYSSWPEGKYIRLNEFDAVFKRLGYDVTKFENVRLPELSKQLSHYQLVIFGGTANYEHTVDLLPYAKEWRKYVADGGVIYIEDANYGDLLGKFLPGFGKDFELLTSQCSAHTRPSQESQRITFRDEPLNFFPSSVTPSGLVPKHWSHYHIVPKEWVILETCFDKHPIAMVYFYGKGAIVLNVRGVEGTVDGTEYASNFLFNLECAMALKKAGLRVTKASAPNLSVHTGLSFTIEGENAALKKFAFSLSLATSNGETSITPQIQQRDGAVDYLFPIDYPARGKVTFNVNLSPNGKTTFKHSWTYILPELQNVHARRLHFYPKQDTLDLLVEIKPEQRDGKPITMKTSIDGKAAITQTLNDDGGVVSIDISSCALGKHTLDLELYHDKTVILSDKMDFFRHPEPKWRIRDDGTVLKDGKPFFPIGFYHVSWTVPPEKRMAMLKDVGKHGYNCVHTDYLNPQKDRDFKDFLDEAERLGVYIITGPDFQGDQLSVIREWKNHPAVMAWNICDEPETHGLNPEEFANRFAAFKQLDPDHLIYTVICTPKQYKDYACYTDVLAPDPYPLPDSPVDSAFGHYKDSFTEARKYGASLWTVPQCFGNYSGWKRPPTSQENRMMVYLGVLAGAKGFLNFTYFESTYIITDYPELYNGAMAFPDEIKQLVPYLLDGERTVLQTDAHGIYAGRWTLNGKRAYVVLNTSHQKPLPFTVHGNLKNATIGAGAAWDVKVTEQTYSGMLAPMERLVLFCE